MLSLERKNILVVRIGKMPRAHGIYFPTFLLCAPENVGRQDPGSSVHLQVCGLPMPLEGLELHPGHPPH